MMETIRLFVERLIVTCGISGISVPIVRHIVLALVVVIVAYLSFVIGRQLILFFTKIVMKKGTQWNPLLLLSVSSGHCCAGTHAIGFLSISLGSFVVVACYGRLYHGDGDFGRRGTVE